MEAGETRLSTFGRHMEKCEFGCNWVTSSKKKYTHECSECSNVFPCDKVCGHVDCHLTTARKCRECGKRIPNTLPATYYLVDGKGTSCYLVHKSCSEDTLTIEVNEI